MEKLGEFLDFLVGKRAGKSLAFWPPDVFALCAAVLERSGGYLAVATEWPALRFRKGTAWNKYVRKIGTLWRRCAASKARPPAEISRAWAHVLQSRTVTIRAIGDPDQALKHLRETLLFLLAAADEACEGAGIPGGESKLDAFADQCLTLLQKQHREETPSTLCRRVQSSKLCVLPKLHTPKTGLTIRSLSHHLALCAANEVQPNWIWVEYPQLGQDRHGLNVLLLPWPVELDPVAFSPTIPRCGPLRNLDDKFGFFNFRVRGGKALDIGLLGKIVKRATDLNGPVDMIVFPELALTREDIPALATFIRDLNPRPILIGGMYVPVQGGGNACRNTSITVIPLKGGERAFALSQDKHHRWLLDGSQVRQYGLGGVLDPAVDWWEDMVLSRREVGFVSLQPWLTLCTLVCEDLARPDPIANVVRAVGPNLVIALLMDGPQLASRWPARYGTVLADDPGSSVLTLSALGMVKLSRPPGKKPSNIVALWKDAQSGDPIEIELQDPHQGVLLCLTRGWRNEFTADGRSDDGSTSYLMLSGAHPISA
jgi:hypothetical protein